MVKAKSFDLSPLQPLPLLHIILVVMLGCMDLIQFRFFLLFFPFFCEGKFFFVFFYVDYVIMFLWLFQQTRKSHKNIIWCIQSQLSQPTIYPHEHVRMYLSIYSSALVGAPATLHMWNMEVQSRQIDNALHSNTTAHQFSRSAS